MNAQCLNHTSAMTSNCVVYSWRAWCGAFNASGEATLPVTPDREQSLLFVPDHYAYEGATLMLFDLPPAESQTLEGRCRTKRPGDSAMATTGMTSVDVLPLEHGLIKLVRRRSLPFYV